MDKYDKFIFKPSATKIADAIARLHLPEVAELELIDVIVRFYLTLYSYSQTFRGNDRQVMNDSLYNDTASTIKRIFAGTGHEQNQ